DRSSDGAFHALRDLAEERVRAIIEEAAADTDAALDSDHGRVGALYRMFMDEEAVEAAGTRPLEGLLEQITSAADLAQIVREMAAPDSGTSMLLAYVWTDDHDSTSYQVKIHQGGLGLPDESYYREEQYAEIRQAYQEHLAQLATLAGLVGREGLLEGAAADLAAAVMASETRVAARLPLGRLLRGHRGSVGRHRGGLDRAARVRLRRCRAAGRAGPGGAAHLARPPRGLRLRPLPVLRSGRGRLRLQRAGAQRRRGAA